MGEDTANQQPRVTSPGPCVYIKYTFDAMGRAGGARLKGSQFLAESGISSEIHGIRANGVWIWGRREYTHLMKRGTTWQDARSWWSGVFVLKCE